nr:hypothetical transcript [Hymenolepis microstoma]
MNQNGLNEVNLTMSLHMSGQIREEQVGKYQSMSKWHLNVKACIGQRVLQQCYEHGASEFQISMWQFVFDSRPNERAANYLCRPHNMNSKSKWHLNVKACIGQRVLQQCYEHGASEFQISMWQFVFDSRPNERAANYLCRPHNMNIFRTHRDQCYKPHEARASICTQRASRDLARLTALLSTQTEDVTYSDGMNSGQNFDDSNRASFASDYVAYIQEQISAVHYRKEKIKSDALNDLPIILTFYECLNSSGNEIEKKKKKQRNVL